MGTLGFSAHKSATPSLVEFFFARSTGVHRQPNIYWSFSCRFVFLAISSAALVLVLTPLAQAQTVVAPASTPAAAVPEPAAAPAIPAKANGGNVSEGKVAHYGRKFNSRKTASGERFNAGAMTIAQDTAVWHTGQSDQPGQQAQRGGACE